MTVGERLAPAGDDDLDWPVLTRADGVYVTAGDAGGDAAGARARGCSSPPPGPARRLTGDGPAIDALVFSVADRDECGWARRAASRRRRLMVATEGGARRPLVGGVRGTLAGGAAARRATGRLWLRRRVRGRVHVRARAGPADPGGGGDRRRVWRADADARRRALVSVGSRMRTYVRVSERPTILHADLDAFYASVEQRDDPRLRGRPVIVGAGVVLAASYEAKACGVRTAMGGSAGRALCPRAVVVPPRMSAYTEASRAVFEIFEQTSPLVEALSIDEAFLDVRGLERISGTPTEIARRLRREVRERGRAADHRRRGAHEVLGQGGERRGQARRPAGGAGRRRAGVPAPAAGRAAMGRRAGDRRAGCTSRGITTVGEVARLEEEALVAMLGRAGGPAAARARAQP